MTSFAEQWIYYLFCCAFFAMPLGTSPPAILGGVILLMWIFSGEFLRRRDGFIHEKWLLPVICMILLTWIGLMWSPDSSGLGLKYAKKTHYWLYALALTSIRFSRNPPENLIKAFLGGLLLNSLVGYLQLFGIVPRFAHSGATGYSGFYSGYNTLAILLVLGVMTASFYFRTASDKRNRSIYAFMMVIYFIHLIILEGRGGYITFVLLLPIIAFNILHGRSRVFMILIYLIALGLMFSSPVVRGRIKPAVEAVHILINGGGDLSSVKEYSGFDRIYMWREAVRLFIKHPFLGVGTGGYKQAMMLEGGDRGIAHPHNNILFMAASFGIPGLCVFFWLFWVLLESGWRGRKSPVGFFVLASSLVILVGGLTDTHILDAGGATLLAMTTGLLSVLPKTTVAK